MGQSLLARLSYMGLAKETVQGTYVPPTAILPVTNLAPEDVYAPLRDESLRNNDSVLQGLYQGPADSNFAFDMSAYPDLVGHLLRAAVGADTTTAAAVSTTLAAAAAIGATSITVTSATGITAGQALMLDTAANVEYVQVAPSYTTGTTIPLVNALTIAHASAAPAVSQTTHTFKQSNNRQPSYSLTDFDVVESRGYAGCVLEELGIKIDPKAVVSLTTKWQGYPSASQANPVTSFTKAQPLLGWQWTMTNAGASSNRGISLDWSIKREVESIHASTGTQAPEEVFPGALTLEGTYKARFDGNTDLLLYLNYIQSPVSCVITQPVTPTQMGASLTITTSQGGFSTGKTNRTGKYIDADFSILGINNTTDGGTMQAVLKNFTTTAF